MLVQVTAEHIKNGWKSNPRRCPVAMAMYDLGFAYVSVRSITCFYAKTVDDETKDQRLPKEARRFIAAFDIGQEVEPLTFILGD